MTSMQDWLGERVDVLERSADADEIAGAASELAFSDQPAALEALGRFLRRPEFLARLDDIDPQAVVAPTLRLGEVLEPLAQRPSREVVALCLSLADDPAFVTGADRKSFLLDAMARVAPMEAATAEAFRVANEEGYFAFVAPLLADNASLRALDLLFGMLTDADVDIAERVEATRGCILHRRTRLPILQFAWRLLESGTDETVVMATIQAVFEYQRRWFTLHTPMPPAWRSTDDDTLRFVIELGVRAKRRPVLPDDVQRGIDSTLDTVRALLEQREER